jgi:hypothetical protein
MAWSRDPGSFRDRGGFVFRSDGVLYRQVDPVFAPHYSRLMHSGLYEELVRDRLMVAHTEDPIRMGDAPAAHAVLRPDLIPFVSYPYEWCFSQLKAAALLTLELQRRAVARSMTLRDASAYNVQFVGTRPIFIDTLSFGEYLEGAPWVAYRQFCEHFLAPLALMAHTHHSLGNLARLHGDGIPLTLASGLLPLSTRARPGLLMHVHLHAKSAARANRNGGSTRRTDGLMSRTAMLGLVDSLERTVNSIEWTPPATVWSDYDKQSNYSDDAQAHKRRTVAAMLTSAAQASELRTLWDLGANTGEYSRLAAGACANVISLDADHAVVERNFRASSTAAPNILPLVQDLRSPSPGTGWSTTERRSLLDRGPADAALALALVHHLAIGANVPLASIAAFFARVCRSLIVEFVPKSDSQIQRMLAFREDVFDDYTQEAFERAFDAFFKVVRFVPIDGTLRGLYLMERR